MAPNRFFTLRKTPKFDSAYKKLIKSTPEIEEKITLSIKTFMKDPLNPPADFKDEKFQDKKLKRKHGNIRKFKPTQDCRLAYIRKDRQNEIVFLFIGTRKDFYKKVVRLPSIT